MMKAKTDNFTLIMTSMVLSALGACGPPAATPPVESSPEGRQLADAVCAARETCGCGDSRFNSTEECHAAIATPVDLALAHGVVIDDGCFEWLLDSDILLACAGGPPPDTAYVPCTLASGNKNEGDSCTTYDFAAVHVSDCKEGLRCWNGTCTSIEGPFEPLEPGAPCDRAQGCGIFSLYCGHDRRCHPVRALGEECDDYLACNVSSYCKGFGEANTGTCAPKESPGSVCDAKDWRPCDSPDLAEAFYMCDPETSTCTTESVWLCWWTHPVRD
jgi:hypothetical protein